MSVTIFHNPRCSKSRQALGLLQEKGVDATVVKYLDSPPSAQELDGILKMLDMQPRDLMRKKEKEYKELNLADETLSREQLIAAMVATPRLIERPIVVKDGKAAVGRPPESVLRIL